ncbi:uncharacterized protein LOC128200062 isoform X2 [Galleria mellonella]|uniref:Uncharacterized protein LOC128200062 isoform X2 n=1 Tax=Galleria mellonella TaxID=7137 RepID=A0ABM3M9F9_GALME|nr:uncharacterized protein LOC128200062 isoform X2 [Galleria mellonella]
MDLKSLIKKRGSYKARLTQFSSYLNVNQSCESLSSLQINELNIRLSKIEELYSDFDCTQIEIENLSEIPDDQYKERETFETQYFGVIAAARDMLTRSAPASAETDSGSVAGSASKELQTRHKWKQTNGQLQIGEMVLIKDDRLPPSRWLLGRVTTLYPGSDGITRVADVRTATGTLRRAFNRLCPLPILIHPEVADQDLPQSSCADGGQP